MSIEKPLTRFMSDHYNEDFSDVIKDVIEFGEKIEPEEMKLLINKAYYEGLVDGLRLIIEAIEY